MLTKTFFTKNARKLVLALSATTLLAFNSNAQCLTTDLDITTGVQNGTVLSNTPDPHWDITYVQTPIAGYPNPITPPTDAYVTSNPSHWDRMSRTVGGSTQLISWISLNNTYATPGYPIEADQTISYERRFSVCEEGEFTFNLEILNDNYILNIEIESQTASPVVYPLYGGQTPTNANTHTQLPGGLLTLNPTQSLAAGDYVLRINVVNAYVYTTYYHDNPTGLSAYGSITSSSGSLIDDQNPECEDYECSNCSSQCYWKVDGNFINGNNIFGTLNSYSVNIQTEGHERGILTPGGSNASDPTAGRFGWNTMSPTARLHVDCINGNEDGSGTSDIRFENLEAGEGYVLVIDDAGYVYNTYMSVSDLSGMAQELRTEKNKNDELQKRVDALTARVGMLEQNTTGADNLSNLNNKLYQNTPNPFDKSTTIKYSIKSMNNSAYIIVYDLNGRELNKTAVEGDGSITIDDNTLTPGMYLYSLVIDGVAVDTKRMVLSK